MAYRKTFWKPRIGINKNRFGKAQETTRSVILHNQPDAITEPGTPFSDKNMNNIEEGIYNAHELISAEEQGRLAADQEHRQAISAETQNRTAAIQAHNTNQSAHADIRSIINTLTGLPVWDSNNHILTFTAKDGSTLVVDIPLEELAKDIGFDPATKEIILYKHDGTEIRIDISDLVDIYTGSLGAHIQITIGDSNQIQAALRAGTITEAELSAVLLSKINGKLDAAAQAADSAKLGGQLPGVFAKQADMEAADQNLQNQISALDPQGLDARFDAKQDKLNRTIGGNDDATGTVDDTGGNLSVPISLTVAAPAASSTQTTATAVNTPRTLRAQLKLLIDNIAHLFANKANDADVVKLTGNQTIAGTKTFSTSPPVPSKSTAAGNNATTIATEAQVALKANIASPTFTGTVAVPEKSAAIAASAAANTTAAQRTAVATEAQVASTRNALQTNIDTKAGFSTSSDANLQDYPVGSYIICYIVSGTGFINRNANTNPYTSKSENYSFYNDNVNGNLQLGGVWRSSGMTTPSGMNTSLLRKVAV